MPEEIVKLTIDDLEVEVEKGISILEAALKVGIEIPSLCYLKEINEIGACRVCVVEIEGVKALQASCVYPITQPVQVYTNTERVRKARKRVVELLLSEHDRECTMCIRNLNCELQNVADNLGVRNLRATGESKRYPIQMDNPFIMRDYNKCISCRRCQAICDKIQEVHVYSAQRRGLDTVIAPAFMRDLGSTNCITCGQCVIACPTGSLVEREATEGVWAALADKDKYVVVQTAPSIQVTLGEMFGMETGTIVTGKLVAALRRLGFKRVFPTDISADLTIMEEAHELIERLQRQSNLPLLSSCCPAWVKFAEHFYPQFLENLSSCKSPHEMFGAMIKTYYAEKEGLDPTKIVSVAVMPCTAKKYEAARPEMGWDGYRDIDHVITTRELGRMIRQAGIHFRNLPDEAYDMPFGVSSGAGAIFGATGGVIEAAIRSAYAILNKKNWEMGLIDFEELRGQSGLKEAKVDLGSQEIKVVIAHGTGNARIILDRILNGAHYDYIEIMGCPGGCVGGGGQPILGGRDHKRISLEYRHNRADALYKIDMHSQLRQSHDNPDVKNLYEAFLGQPLGEKAKKLLHTTYTPRGSYFNLVQ